MYEILLTDYTRLKKIVTYLNNQRKKFSPQKYSPKSVPMFTIKASDVANKKNNT